MGNTDFTKYALILLMVGIILLIVEEIILFASYGQFDLSFSGFFALIGLILMFLGRKEYGEKHRKFVIYAGVIFLITVVFFVIYFIGLFVTIMNAVEVIGDQQPVDLGFFHSIFLVAPIGGFLGALYQFFLVYHLENETGKKLLYMVFFSFIIFTLAFSYHGYQVSQEWIPKVENTINGYIEDPPLFLMSYSIENDFEELTKEFYGKLSMIGVFTIVPNILLLIAIYIPYKRISSGELQTVLPNHLKRCNSCGRVTQKEYRLCPYCGKTFDNYQNIDSVYQQNYRNY